MESKIWTEKYRPKRFEEVIGLPEGIAQLVGEKMPHLLFWGKPGTGKTTTAKIIIKNLSSDLLSLNASDERGIDVVREKIKTFAMTRSRNGEFKIIHLDEADMMTKEAQNSLRNLMETYANNARFILTCNHVNKIEDAIKSRCTSFEFKAPEPAFIGMQLKEICDREGIDIDEAVLFEMLKSMTDIRAMINKLQYLSSLNRKITMEDLKAEKSMALTIHSLMLEKRFPEARQTLLDGSVEYEVFLKDYHELIIDLCLRQKKLSSNKTAKIIENLSEAMVNIGLSISKEIVVENFILKTIKVLKEEE